MVQLGSITDEANMPHVVKKVFLDFWKSTKKLMKLVFSLVFISLLLENYIRSLNIVEFLKEIEVPNMQIMFITVCLSVISRLHYVYLRRVSQVGDIEKASFIALFWVCLICYPLISSFGIIGATATLLIQQSVLLSMLNKYAK